MSSHGVPTRTATNAKTWSKVKRLAAFLVRENSRSTFFAARTALRKAAFVLADFRGETMDRSVGRPASSQSPACRTRSCRTTSRFNAMATVNVVIQAPKSAESAVAWVSPPALYIARTVAVSAKLVVHPGKIEAA